MTVKVRKSSARREESPPESRPEPRAPAARSIEPDVPEPRVAASRRPEPEAPERQNAGGDAAPARVAKHKGSISITLPSYSFAPLKFGSFVVPAVSMTIDIDDVVPSDDAGAAAVEALRELQETLYEQEIKTYFDRAERAYKEAARRFGADD